MATRTNYQRGLVITEYNGTLIAEWTMKDIQLTEHFILAEMCASDTAKAKGISNEPNEVELGHLRLLCTYLLEPLRQA